MKIEITKEQAYAMCDFLEAEFINGIWSYKLAQDTDYVKNIKAVYDKFQEVSNYERDFV